MERFIQLAKRHKEIMETKNIIVSVYTNASGFLWEVSKVDSGTGLGWSDHQGDCEYSGAFTTYENALQDILDLIDKCDLEKFKKETIKSNFHWGNYSNHLNTKYR